MGSWEFFDALADPRRTSSRRRARASVRRGEGYIRLTAFGDADATVEAVERIKKLAAEGAF
jgi:LL-diaminopimelate aminotransferase